jgi:hypothetical protein
MDKTKVIEKGKGYFRVQGGHGQLMYFKFDKKKFPEHVVKMCVSKGERGAGGHLGTIFISMNSFMVNFFGWKSLDVISKKEYQQAFDKLMLKMR